MGAFSRSRRRDVKAFMAQIPPRLTQGSVIVLQRSRNSCLACRSRRARTPAAPLVCVPSATPRGRATRHLHMPRHLLLAWNIVAVLAQHTCNSRPEDCSARLVCTCRICFGEGCTECSELDQCILSAAVDCVSGRCVASSDAGFPMPPPLPAQPPPLLPPTPLSPPPPLPSLPPLTASQPSASMPVVAVVLVLGGAAVAAAFKIRRNGSDTHPLIPSSQTSDAPLPATGEAGSEGQIQLQDVEAGDAHVSPNSQRSLTGTEMPPPNAEAGQSSNVSSDCNERDPRMGSSGGAGTSSATGSAGRSSDATDTGSFVNNEESNNWSRVDLLKNTSQRVHIISTPFSSEQGRSLAEQVKKAFSGVQHEHCYNPNEDHPQTLPKSWLKSWMAICNNTARTGGTVFVVFRSDGKGKYGCRKKGPGSLDGQAQEGEIRYARGKGCIIHWMDQTNPEAAMREMNQLITHSQK